ncbi:MAG TPA: ABC transporter permease [Candidatus Limiplasma pullistercoris]|nr:ABC transporter permease [Candidatus Limiplasma pullistercoris]
MKRYDFWKLSLLNIFAAPARSVLTVLGMAIGIGAILAVITLGDAGRAQVKSEMTRLGIDRVWLTAAEGETLRHGDAQLLASALDATATEQVYAPATARAGRREESCVLVGCSREYMDLMGTGVLEGRDLYAAEWQPGARSVLLGAALAEKLGVESGELISVSGVPLWVRGIIAQGNELSQVDASGAVFLPIAVFCEWMGQGVHEIILSVPEGVTPQAVAAMAQDVMRVKRDMSVEAVTMQVQIEAANSVMSIFVDVLKWVAAICILVGGIGVMNILLVSVRERRREIGIMKSLGTTEGQICLLFLLEALVYALVGGCMGLVIGIGLIETAGRSIGLTPVIRLGDCAAVFLAALAVGLVFGVSPASRASRMKPVDALRDE